MKTTNPLIKKRSTLKNKNKILGLVIFNMELLQFNMFIVRFIKSMHNTSIFMICKYFTIYVTSTLLHVNVAWEIVTAQKFFSQAFVAAFYIPMTRLTWIHSIRNVAVLYWDRGALQYCSFTLHIIADIYIPFMAEFYKKNLPCWKLCRKK